MKRDRITIGENGVIMTGSEVWMTAMELAELFDTTAGAVNTGIKAIIKSDTLHDYEVCTTLFIPASIIALTQGGCLP